DVLVADADERRREVEANVVDVLFEGPLLVKAVRQDVEVAVLLLLEDDAADLVAAEQGGTAEQALELLAQAVGIAHLRDERERRQLRLRLLGVRPLLLVDDDDPVIRPELRQRLAQRDAAEEWHLADLHVGLLDALGVLLAEDLDALLPDLGEVV